MELLVKREPGNDDLPMMEYMTEHAAGMDIYAAVKEDVILKPGETKLIPTGMSIAVPIGYEAQIRPRSGLALKKEVTVLNTPGTIDADYRGPVGIILANMGKEDFVVKRADRVAQMVIAPVVQAKPKLVDELPATDRGEGGFGSTGV